MAALCNKQEGRHTTIPVEAGINSGIFYSGIPHSHEKEQTSDTCNNVNGSHRHTEHRKGDMSIW